MLSRRAFMIATLAFYGAPAVAQGDERQRLTLRWRDGVAGTATPTVRTAVFEADPAGLPVRVRRGVPQALTLQNALDIPVALHWRGLRAGLGTTGMADIVVDPGAALDVDLTAPDSGLLLLEARSTGTAPASLHAVLPVLVADAEPGAIPEVVVLIGETGPDESGKAVFVANDQTDLTLPVAVGVPLLLRCANISRQTPFLLIVDGAAAAMVGLDSQPIDAATPWPEGGAPLLPGTRCDLMLAGLPSEGGAIRLLVDDGAGPRPIGRVVAAQPEPPDGPVAPIMPPPNPALPTSLDLAGAVRSDVIIGETQGPGLLTADVGATIVLRLVNRTAEPAIVHLRGQTARILHALDDGWEPYWTDTLLVMPQSERLVVFMPTVVGEWRIEMTKPDSEAPPMITAFTVR